MKIIRVLICIVVAISTNSCNDNSSSTESNSEIKVENHLDKNAAIVGEWKGINKNGEAVSIVFDNTNHAIFIIGNLVLGGKDFEVEKGKKSEYRYEINTTKDPMWLDLVMFESGKDKEVSRAKGIVRFITNKKIEYRINLKGPERFEKFSSENTDDTLVLEKV